jgi:hypothetical protein
MSNLLLLIHPMFGVLAILTATWVLVEALNLSQGNLARLKVMTTVVAVFIWLACLFGGYWYVFYYGADKAVILKGPWPIAHSFFMETKEHLFFMLLIIATLLPIAAREDLVANKAARRFVVWLAGLVIALGLVMEGSGAIISIGAKLGLLPA